MNQIDRLIDYPTTVGRNVSPERASKFGALPDRVQCGVIDPFVRMERERRAFRCRVKFWGASLGILASLVAAACHRW